MAETRKIAIACRLRPFLPSESSDDGIEIVDDTSLSIVNPRDPTQRFKFNFQSCYDQNSSQVEIFVRDVQPMIDLVYAGITVTIFAYGVTSSGKTHTMQGSVSEPGIIPRVVKALFLKKKRLRRFEVELSVSYMEIYKDDVYDLLVPRENGTKLPVRENDEGKVFVANLTEKPITSPEEFDKLYATACKSRSTGSTNLNHASSRSHAILVINVSIVDTKEDKTLTGKINLVDLAGSENNKMTGNDASRMAESSAINKSLSVLGQVVHALNQGAQRIPYRDSKLTRILQDALGGSSAGLLICNLAPGAKFRQDTLNTLNFAARTKEIENRPVVNERDNKPPAKPHFSAITAPRQSLALPRPSLAGPRPSALPAPMPRLQGPSVIAKPVMREKGKLNADDINDSVKEEEDKWKISQEEIEKKIAKAVAEEVAKRLAEFSQAKPVTAEPPAGSVTPFIKKHAALEADLRARLESLEQKLERGDSDAKIAEALSPTSRRKTAKAFLAVARASQDDNKLDAALQLYLRAQIYAPSNSKLKERVEQVKYALENGVEVKRIRHSFPSPEASVENDQEERPGFKIKRTRDGGEKGKASALVDTTNENEGDDDERGSGSVKKARRGGKDRDGDEWMDVDEEWVPTTPKKRRIKVPRATAA